jgi:hypothetical protein
MTCMLERSELKMTRKVFLMLANALVICLLIVQPVLAKRGGGFSLQGEYKIEFAAEATGPFAILEGIIGPEPVPMVAVGEGTGKFDGDAAVDHMVDDIYLDFPAAMKADGEIKGVISPVVDDVVVSDETWRFELEFWNLENAGCAFWPEEDTAWIASDAPPEPVFMPCLGYKLELERLDFDEDDEELKMSGEAYAMLAVAQLGEAPYESFVILIDVAGTTYTILFTEHPMLESEVEMEVELDAD